MTLSGQISLQVHAFYKKKVYKKMRFKWSKSYKNLKKITRLNFQNLVFLLVKIIEFHHYCFQFVKDGSQVQVYNSNNKCLTHFSQFISEKIRKNLRKPQAQFRGKLRKLRHWQNCGFLVKKNL